MDALSEVLGHVRLKDTSWACVLAGAPWGLELESTRGCVRFHYVAYGSCWLSVEGHPSIALAGGDLAVLPHGHAHTLRAEPRSRVTSLREAMKRAASRSSPADHHVKVGGASVETNLVHGAFLVDDPDDAPILATLPPVLKITPDAGEPVAAFQQNLQFISRELDRGRAGSKLVLTRMADVILVQLLRAYIESLPEGSEGFPGALRDKHTAAALGMMHPVRGSHGPSRVSRTKWGSRARASRPASPRWSVKLPSPISRAFECGARRSSSRRAPRSRRSLG